MTWTFLPFFFVWLFACLSRLFHSFWTWTVKNRWDKNSRSLPIYREIWCVYQVILKTSAPLAATQALLWLHFNAVTEWQVHSVKTQISLCFGTSFTEHESAAWQANVQTTRAGYLSWHPSLRRNVWARTQQTVQNQYWFLVTGLNNIL